MTVSTSASSQTFLGNGATNSFQFSFIGVSASDIQVSYTNAIGVVTIIPPTQYILTLNPPATGSLWGVGGIITYPTVGSPISNGTSITVNRIVPFTQLTSISNQGAFAPQVIESALDTIEFQLQQILGRTTQFRGIWVTATSYNVGDIVQDGVAGGNTKNYYICQSANVSGVWGTDLANGDWSLSVQAVIPVGGGTVTNVSVTPQNGVSATVTSPNITPNLAFTLDAITPTTVNARDVVNFAPTVNITATNPLNLESMVANEGIVTGNGIAVSAITLTNGHFRIIRWNDVNTLVNSASLPLPGAANIVTALGDISIHWAEGGSGVVRTVYQKANGQPVTPTASAFNVLYTSAQISIGSNGSNSSTAHGLGATPTTVRSVITCVTAELGWSVGDEIVVTQDRGDNYGIQFGANSTVVKWVIGSSGISIYNFTTGSISAINNANWRFVIYAAK